MPNPELSQYHDHDTDTLYDLKDDAARTDITAIKKEIMAVLYMNVIALAQDYSFVVFELNPGLIGTFDETQDGDCIRCIFPHFENADVYPDIPIKLSWGESLSPKFSFVYKDYAHNDKLKWSDVDNKVLDFVYRSFDESFVVVISPASVNADDVLYDNTVSGLSASNVQNAIDELASEKADSSALATVATSGDYDDLLNKPTIPSAQVNSDWNAVSGVAQILNKPSLATVATSGSYNDLTDQPTIPDISTKMDKSNPTGTGKLSINRLYNSTEGVYSVAVGNNTTASGSYSHAEGNVTVASGSSSHAEGTETTASGNNGSHAEGQQTEASGRFSHAEGNNTIAASDAQHVSGKYNIADNADTYAEIIGNGTADNSRSNARTLDWSGNETIAGDLYFNGNVTALSSQLSAKADSSSLAAVATSGLYSDLSGTPTIPAAQVNSDWNANSGVAEILNKPSLATVATSGLYSDLSGTPTIPSGVDTFVDASLPSLTGTDFDSYSSGRVICPVNMAKSIGTIEVPAGYWILEISAMWYSNGTGYRMLGLSTTKNTFSTNKNYTISQNAVNGVETYQRIAIVVHPTETKRYHIVVKQNVGDIYVSPEYKAIRLEH